MKTLRLCRLPAADLGLLYLRVSAAALLLYVHGLPKLMHFQAELERIDDPLGLGRVPTLWLALLAEVLSPLAIALGWFTRLAALPVLVLLLVSMLLVHPEWSVAEGQFGWLLLSAFGTVALAGPGAYSLDGRHSRVVGHAP